MLTSKWNISLLDVKELLALICFPFRESKQMLLTLEEMLENQQSREEERIHNFEINVEKLAQRFLLKKDASAVLKDMEQLVNTMKEHSIEERETLDEKQKVIQKGLELQAETNSSGVFCAYEEYIKKAFDHIYDVEHHCDRFTSYWDKQLEEFEEKTEAKLF